MTEAHSKGPQDHGEDHVGSIAEEAAKLFEVLHGVSGKRTASASSVTDATGSFWQDLNRHLVSDGDCRYCPVCQLIGVIRQPEVREHLASAGRSLVAALASALETRVPDDAPPPSSEPPSHRDDGAV